MRLTVQYNCVGLLREQLPINYSSFKGQSKSGTGMVELYMTLYRQYCESGFYSRAKEIQDVPKLQSKWWESHRFPKHKKILHAKKQIAVRTQPKLWNHKTKLNSGQMIHDWETGKSEESLTTVHAG